MDTLARPADPMRDFQTKIVERLRDDIRELLPQDVLDGLVTRAVDETFFKPRSSPQRYGPDILEPSWFVTELAKAAKPLLDQAVKDFLTERKAVIDQAIADFLTTERLQVLLADRLSAQMSNVLSLFLTQMQHR